MAAPTYQAIGTLAAGGGTVSPSWPTHAVGDIAILAVVAKRTSGVDPGAATLSVDAGFTAVTGGSDLTDVGTTFQRVTLFWCRATSTSMGAPTVADSHSFAAAVIITFRGCIASGDPYDGASTATNTTSNASFTVPGVTTTGSNRLAVIVAGYPEDRTMGSQANANLTSISERLDSTDAGSNIHIAITTGIATAAGDYGDTTATLSANAIWAAVTVALKPEASASTSGNLLLLGVG